MFISLFVALCLKLDPDTHKGNAFTFDLKTGCDSTPNQIFAHVPPSCIFQLLHQYACSGTPHPTLVMELGST
jgi:hypothetical protein